MRLAVDERVDLSLALEDSIIQLRKEVPQELVVSMFQKLVRVFPHIAGHPDEKINRLVIFYLEFTPNNLHTCRQADGADNKTGYCQLIDEPRPASCCADTAPATVAAELIC